MATFHRLHERDTCSICGCSDVQLDYFDGDAPLELGECPRCNHRFTRSLRPAQARPEAVHTTVTRLFEDDARLPYLPNAA